MTRPRREPLPAGGHSPQHITGLLSAGALSLLTGLLAVGLTPLRRAMNNHRKDTQ